MAFEGKDGLNQDFLDELKFKCDIVSVVSQYVPLTKKGGKYFGCCPFHNEKTASMCVNTDGQYYHCFGCGASGNVITFVKEMESVGFYEAVKILAERAGMTMPEFKLDPEYGKKKEKSEILKNVMRDAARFYRANLLKEKEGKEAREYLAGRGITTEVSAHYGLGLSLGGDQLQQHLRLKGYSVGNLKECGLVTGDNLSDAFADRIIVPIMAGAGNVIAFGGRIYHSESPAKYKNSTNTPLFDKSKCVYGLNFIKREKREHGAFSEIILVEGYMDVISLGAAGIKNAVAGMGTALTKYQAMEIKRCAPTVYVCYDGDSAGKTAAIRNVEPLLEVGAEVKVVPLSEGMDPDDTVKKEGYEGFMARVKAALPVIEYKLKLCEEAYDLKSVDGRAKYVKAATKVLSKVESPAQKEVYLMLVSSLSGVSVDTLKIESKTESKQTSSANTSARAQDIKPTESREMKAARYVLNRLLLNASVADVEKLQREWFTDALHAEIFDFVTRYEKGKVNTSSIFEALSDNANEERNNILAAEIPFKDNEAAAAKRYYDDCALVLANAYLSLNVNILKKQYNSLTDQKQKRDCLTRMSEVQQKLKSDSITDKFI